jgi:ankyrin repeat protein
MWLPQTGTQHLSVSKTAIYIVGSVIIILNFEDILLEYGANPQSKSTAQLTPLHQAARHGSYTCAELLLAHGAVVDALCSRDWTPLHHACAMGNTDLIALLVDHGADVNHTDTV